MCGHDLVDDRDGNVRKPILKDGGIAWERDIDHTSIASLLWPVYNEIIIDPHPTPITVSRSGRPGSRAFCQ